MSSSKGGYPAPPLTTHPEPATVHEPHASPPGESVHLEETLVIKEGNLFVVSARDGRLPGEGRHPLGLYYNDCRFLSVCELRVAGSLPLLLVASDSLGNKAVHELTNNDLQLDDGSLLPAQTLQVRIERSFSDTRTMRDLITIRSHHLAELKLPLEITVAADFVPMLEVRGVIGPDARPAARLRVEGSRVVIEARGRDEVLRSTSIVVLPEPESSLGGTLAFDLELPPGGEQSLELEYEVRDGEEGEVAPPPLDDRALAEHTRIVSDDQLFNRVLRRSLLDLHLLRSELGGQRYYAAGIPWYATLFGRDSLITAFETLAFAPEVAEETLRVLARRLGRTVDDEREEEPGKVIHELRGGEVAHLGETPLANYYGSADATPLFLCLLCDHADWTGDRSLFRELRPEVDAALAWMDEFGDLDGDGLLEYSCRSPRGLRNQGWKDSHDGVMHDVGTPLEPPIALVEVQAYALRAKRLIARLLQMEGETGRAAELLASATVLEEGLESFWLEDLGYYSLALDGDKRPSRALASNQGHLLWAGAVTPERARRVRDALMSEAMFSGWGIRTLARGERAYNPVGYHTGSIWPHDNAMIARGFRNYGFDEDLMSVFEAMLEAASQFPNYRLPELFAGFSRSEYERPVPYPVACRPQAWAAGAIPYLMNASLGLRAVGFDRRLEVLRPLLPHWVTRVDMAGVRLAGANVDLSFQRENGHVEIADVSQDGNVDVGLDLTPG